MGNLLCTKSKENIKLISEKSVNSYQENIIMLHQKIKENNKEIDDLKSQNKLLTKDNRYLKQDNRLKQRSNFNLLSKIHEYEQIKQKIDTLVNMKENDIIDSIIDKNSRGGNNWFHNKFKQRNIYKNVIKYYNNKLYDLILHNDSDRSN